MKTKKSDEQEIIDFYKEEAEVYDIERFYTSQKRYIDKIQKNIVINMIDSWDNKNILDIECVTGKFSIEVANRSRIVTALDPSIPMLKELRKKVKIAFYNPRSNWGYKFFFQPKAIIHHKKVGIGGCSQTSSTFLYYFYYIRNNILLRVRNFGWKAWYMIPCFIFFIFFSAFKYSLFRLTKKRTSRKTQRKHGPTY